TAQGNSKWASSPKSNGYMDIKLDAPKTIKRWRVEHAEYGGEAYNGGNALKIEGNFKAGDTNEVMLYSTKLNVTDTTKVDVVTK
ncbi:hypothetical protein PT148_09120, partial [Erysipelothrix rhusiopathiae]|nr:hypothetical protein [Erysipelothrix rhusiopathiae]